MAKNILILCNGLSGSGKTTFIENYLGNLIYNLKSMTTREPREKDVYGEKYYFVEERDFETEPLATHLFVNQAFWTPGEKKWLYGVPEFEITNNLGKNMVYDVIQPRYSRQLIDWFIRNGLEKYYDFKVMWFLPPSNNFDIAKKRANMPNDELVRKTNTCDAIDFLRADLVPDYLLRSSAEETLIPLRIHKMISSLPRDENLNIPQRTAINNKYTEMANLVMAAGKTPHSH